MRIHPIIFLIFIGVTAGSSYWAGMTGFFSGDTTENELLGVLSDGENALNERSLGDVVADAKRAVRKQVPYSIGSMALLREELIANLDVAVSNLCAVNQLNVDECLSTDITRFKLPPKSAGSLLIPQ
jgi:hypothetical protein